MFKSADFSDCGTYRYMLTRIWDMSKPNVAFCMLNPSTADELVNDPTVERCERRARMLGYGGLVVVNLFAFRATDPNELYDAEDPVGPDNDAFIKDAIKLSSLFVCGWGNHGTLTGRNLEVLNLLKSLGIEPHALKINMDGSPAHPLYIAYKAQPILLK